jgi:hypothetical protein
MQSKTLFPLFALIALIVVVGLACSTSSPSPTPTPTQIPPTDTSLPTPTETPPPTATPDYAATQAAQATAAVAARQAEIEAELQKLELPTDNGHVLWVQAEDVALHMVGGMNQMDYAPLAEGITASDFVLKVDMIWDTNSWPVCGLVFRASEEDLGFADFYLVQFLRFSGLPAWDIEYYKRGDYVTTITQKVRFSDALKLDSGAVNQIVLHAVENNFTVYINGRRQGRYPDFSNILHEGSFAVAGIQDGGETTCTFSNGWIWSYK